MAAGNDCCSKCRGTPYPVSMSLDAHIVCVQLHPVISSLNLTYLHGSRRLLSPPDSPEEPTFKQWNKRSWYPTQSPALLDLLSIDNNDCLVVINSPDMSLPTLHNEHLRPCHSQWGCRYPYFSYSPIYLLYRHSNSNGVSSLRPLPCPDPRLSLMVAQRLHWHLS